MLRYNIARESCKYCNIYYLLIFDVIYINNNYNALHLPLRDIWCGNVSMPTSPAIPNETYLRLDTIVDLHANNYKIAIYLYAP